MVSNLADILLLRKQFDLDAQVLLGEGSPEGVVVADPGTIYRDKAFTNGAILWAKVQNSNATGWKCVIGDTGWRNIKSLIAWPTGVTIDNGMTTAVLLRRINDDCFFTIADGMRASATFGPTKIYDLPAGFAVTGLPDTQQTPIFERNSSAICGFFETTAWANQGAGQLRMSVTNAAPFATVNTKGIHRWRSGQLWPTSLPGEPYTSNLYT